MISKFYSRYKTNPFNPDYKKYQDIITTVRDHGNQEFLGATGRQFKHAQKLGLFEDIRNIELAKDIQVNFRKKSKVI